MKKRTKGFEGRVFLVGAGPGDPELLTKKAERIIKEADVILYDQLIGSEIIKSFPAGAELIDVGKHAGLHKFEQDEITQMLIEHAREGKIVVRLKGGDPYLFGRGGEEAEALAAEGIGVEVVPGVTSAIAAPACAGIPVTHRECASMVTFITGHEDPTKEKSALDWNLLAKMSGTLVVLMGVKGIERNVNALLRRGKNPETPVALVERGTTDEQKVTIGVLRNIVQLAEAVGVKPPAVMVIGDVVRLHETLGRRK
ncbi:MAG: uroporphyrinogen-III C-methyltransferase [Methanosarcinales archaeon Met12]|nr:MAG: uroporphyrinogen-III C-methyltransferase [Methanosarcinales archaeon Met12]